jgi:CRISPR-associated protein Csx3
MTTFPAVLIGGPPHSGKSVLVYSLTHALRERSVAHYVLRACPDGEGDWSNEAEQQQVQFLRYKGQFTPEFVDRMAAFLQRRHLPLLVDVGGKPTDDQEALFSYCTHAVLLISRNRPGNQTYEEALTEWRERMVRQGVTIIAELVSDLTGQNVLTVSDPVLQGTLAGLERGQTAVGPAFAALVDEVANLLAFDEAELARIHLRQAPVELSLDLPALANTLGIENGRWQPHHLAVLEDYLPAGKPLAVYGRAPTWLYAYLGLLAVAAPIWLFDARLGWIEAPTLAGSSEEAAVGPTDVGPTDVSPTPHLYFKQTIGADHTLLTGITNAQYLNIEEADQIRLPMLDTSRGVILSGKLPNWLWTAVSRHYALHLSWIAAYYPPLAGAVTIASKQAERPVGTVIPQEP